MVLRHCLIQNVSVPSRIFARLQSTLGRGVAGLFQLGVWKPSFTDKHVAPKGYLGKHMAFYYASDSSLDPTCALSRYRFVSDCSTFHSSKVGKQGGSPTNRPWYRWYTIHKGNAIAEAVTLEITSMCFDTQTDEQRSHHANVEHLETKYPGTQVAWKLMSDNVFISSFIVFMSLDETVSYIFIFVLAMYSTILPQSNNTVQWVHFVTWIKGKNLKNRRLPCFFFQQRK